jgi:hypothetical protein
MFNFVEKSKTKQIKLKMWFEQLTGFEEKSPQQVRDNLEVVGNKLVSKVNHKEYVFGELVIPTLAELRMRGKNRFPKSLIRLTEMVGDVQELHQQKENNGALFQVASQFNLLEMTGPGVTPEEGVGIYEWDRTQGPACAIACGAGTIYRNYFVEIGGQQGQTAARQINCLNEIERYFENEKHHYWKMSNGYALFTKEGLRKVNEHLEELSVPAYESLKGRLRIGIQQGTEVTLNQNNNRVTQTYCSALPVSYSSIEPELWEKFARFILEAAYEATFWAALDNLVKTGNNKIFLTLVGGGVFGNKLQWILDAIEHTVKMFATAPLDVRIVSYRSSNYWVKQLIDKIA